MTLTKCTYSMIEGSPANVLDFGADPTGVDDSTSAFLSAIASGTKQLEIPAGTYLITQTLVIEGAFIMNGAGARRSVGEIDSGVSIGVTVLNYTGSGTAIQINAGTGNGFENIHLSNFMLVGNGTNGTGIYFGYGNAGVITKSSITNVSILNFGNSNGAGSEYYGLRINRCLTSTFTNVNCSNNKYGFGLVSPDQYITTLTFNTCIAYQCYNGWVINNAQSCSWVNCIGESCNQYGLYIYSYNTNDIVALDFYDFYTESNGSGGDDKNIFISASNDASAPKYINFIGGRLACANNLGNVKAFDCDHVYYLSWYQNEFPVKTLGFITLTNNSFYCKFISSQPMGNFIVGAQPYYGVQIEAGSQRPIRSVSGVLATSEIYTLPVNRGILTIQTIKPGSSTERNAIIGLNTDAKTTELLAGNSTYWATSNTATKISVYYDGSNFVIKNNLVGEFLQVVIDTLCY